MESRRSYLGSITTYKNLGEGAVSDVYQCDYFDELFAYKEYKNSIYVKFINERMKKLSEYYYEETNLVFPYVFIYKHPIDEFFLGYVMDYLGEYEKLCDLRNLDYSGKINILKKSRELLDRFHNKYNFIHTDITPWNFLYNQKIDKVKLIDFDTYIDLKNKGNYLCGYYNEYGQVYGNSVGIDKDLDIFLFNLLTYSIILGVDYLVSLKNICNNRLDVFENKNVRKIFESYKTLECKKSLKKEYVIDYL